MANSAGSSSCHGGTGVNLKLKTLGGLCQHKREGDVLFFFVYTQSAYYKERTLDLFSAPWESSPAGCCLLDLSNKSRLRTRRCFFKKIMVTSPKKNCLYKNELANTYFMKAEQASQCMVRRPSVWISFDRVRRNQFSNDVSEFSSEVHWTFSTPVASGIIPKSHLLWLQVNTSHLSTTCSRSLVVLDVELNLKWWHLVCTSCPFLSVTPNKVGWRILGYTTYSTYITKIQTRLTCCCTLEKFSVFLCITGPYTLKSEIWQVVDIRGWALSIALLPKKSNNTRLVDRRLLLALMILMCVSNRPSFSHQSSHHFPHLNDYSHLQAWNA